jgi:hypothetical protein
MDMYMENWLGGTCVKCVVLRRAGGESLIKLADGSTVTVPDEMLVKVPDRQLVEISGFGAN